MFAVYQKRGASSKTTVSDDVLQAKLEEERAEERAAAQPIVIDKKKSRKRALEAVEIFTPPLVEHKNSDTAASRDAASMVFGATYDDASALTTTLAKLHKFTKTYQMMFNADGLEISFMYNQVMYIMLKVPSTSFVPESYRNLVESALRLAITSAAMKQFAALSASDYTLSFMYDQTSFDNEPLQLLLFPNDGDETKRQRILFKLPTLDHDEEAVQPADHYQYEIHIAGGLFDKNVKALRLQSDTVCISLSEKSMKMASVASNGTHTLTFEIRVGSGAGETCTVKRLPSVKREGVPQITMKHMRSYKLSAPYLESMTAFGNQACCTDVMIRMGVRQDPSNPTSWEEEPLHMQFTMRGDTTAPYTVEGWLATKINED